VSQGDTAAQLIRHSATTDDDDIGDFLSQEASRRVSAQGKRPAAPLEALPEPKLLQGDTLANEEHMLERSPEPLDLRVCISQGRKNAKPNYSSNQSDYLGPREEQNRLAAVRMAAMRSATTKTAIRAFCIDKCVVCMPQGDIDPSDGHSSSSLCCRRSALSTLCSVDAEFCRPVLNTPFSTVASHDAERAPPSLCFAAKRDTTVKTGRSRQVQLLVSGMLSSKHEAGRFWMRYDSCCDAVQASLRNDCANRTYLHNPFLYKLALIHARLLDHVEPKGNATF
jgi:hypothetical protein